MRGIARSAVVAGCLALCLVSSSNAAVGDFIRGDTDGDGVVNPIVDAIYLLDFIFQGGSPPSCMETGDVNDDGIVSLPDAIYLVSIITGCPSPNPCPPLPYPACGPDPTPAVGCLTHFCF